MPSARAVGPWGLGAIAASVLLVVAVGALGESAASPPLGAEGLLPPWSLSAHPPSGLVTALLWSALLVGGLGLAVAFNAVLSGWRPAPKRLLALSFVAVGLLVLVPPMGSADHLSYAAYGRIAVQGGDPYVLAPDSWRGDTDPVVSAVRPPWRSTPSVYGPVATGAMALAAAVGGDDVRTVVWVLSLLCGLAFCGVSLLLTRLAPDDPLPLLLWALNPLLLWELVAGAHVDGLAVLPAVAALAVVASRPALAGALAAVALSVKLPFGVVLLAVLWAARPSRVRVLRAGVAASVVVGVSYLLAGPNALSRTGPASELVSLASPWAPVAHALDGPLGFGTSRWVVRVLAVLLACAVAVALARHLRSRSFASDTAVQAASLWLVLGAAYVLAAPYALPWYDAIAWAPLAVLAARGVPVRVPALVLLAHSLVLAAAYVPGRVEGLSSGVETLTLGFRRDVAPWWAWGVLVCVGLLAARGGGTARAPQAGL